MSQLKKLERSQEFNVQEFNIQFEKKDREAENEELQYSKQTNKQINKQTNKQQIQDDNENVNMTNDLGINMKNLFFKILELLLNKENPIPYIMSSPNIQFTFSVMILIIGGLLLFVSNLMINK